MLDKRCKLKLKDGYTEKDLEKYGFINGVILREKDNQYLYRICVTKNHKYIQIETYSSCFIAGRLQCLLYDLIVDGLVEKVEE